MPRQTKLSDESVRTIRSLLNVTDPPPLASLARKYNVHATTIRRIRDGKLRPTVGA